ncbi:MAG: type II secretion system F family protein [Gammaproteobacteria bacterium]
MPLFQYRGRNQRGEPVHGRLEGPSADAIADQLFNSGVTPIDIAPADITRDVVAGLKALGAFSRSGKIALNDQIFFCRQMYTLLKAGVPILQALSGLRETTQNPALARILGSVSDGLDSGLDLTTALGRHPEFSTLFVSMVQVGESTGSLAEAFQQLAIYLEREKDTRDRVKQALRYPTVVIGAIVMAMFFINIFVIPAFARVYAGLRAELPIFTKMLIASSNFFVAHWPLLLVGMVGAIVAARLYVRGASGRYRWHRLKLRLPIVGRLMLQAALARFGRSLATTLRAGVPLVQAFTVVSRAIDNEFIGARVLQIRDGIERGDTITRTATATGLFPPLVLQMIAVGEETGAVDELLLEVADYYDRELDYSLKNLSTAIEPILIGIIGVMVLILALGVFLPMWDLAAAARR